MSHNQENNPNQQLTDEEQQCLLKCYNEYCKSLSDTKPAMKQPSQNIFFFCKKHSNDKSWSSNIHGNCLKYIEIWQIDGGLLYTAKDVLSYLINLKPQNSGKHVNNAEHTSEVLLFGHWTDCNAYPMTVAGISKKVAALFNKYKDIQKYQCKKKSLKYWENMLVSKTSKRNCLTFMERATM